MEGGLCDSTSGAYAGKVVHCLRGTITLADKVANAEDSGAIAVVISNNAPDGFSDALGASVSGIPAVSVSQEDGATLTGDAAQSATVVNMLDPNKTGYEPWDGTSMATPHVSGAAPLVWSACSGASASAVRNTLDKAASTAGEIGIADTPRAVSCIRA